MHQIQITIFTASLGFMLCAYWLVRKRRLKTSYALLWIGVASFMMLFTLIPKALQWVSQLTGLYYITALLWISFVFVLVLLLHFATVVSNLIFQNRKLAERMAFLERKLQAEERTDLREGKRHQN